jgi:hypothetical protein
MPKIAFKDGKSRVPSELNALSLTVLRIKVEIS